jgi:hypothetical protein
MRSRDPEGHERAADNCPSAPACCRSRCGHDSAWTHREETRTCAAPGTGRASCPLTPPCGLLQSRAMNMKPYASNRPWLRLGLLPLSMAFIFGCNASSSAPTKADGQAYSQADLETDVADSAELLRIVADSTADLPNVATSIQKVKPDEATATIEYGTEPRQKKVLTLKKHDGGWAIEAPQP